MWRDLGFAVRALVRQPLLTVVVAGTIALGIGGSTGVFTVLNAVLIRELPYPKGDQIYVMRALAGDGRPGNLTRREFARIYERENHPTVEAATIVWSQDSQLVGSDKRGHPAVRYGVTDRFFDVFATPMALGRGFQPNENPGRIVITHRVWRDVFASDPDIVGKSVSAEGMALQVMGVTAPEFEFPENPGFFYLMRIGAAYDNVRAYRGFMRLRDGRSQDDLQREVTRLAADLGPDPVTAQRPVFVVEPFLEYVVGDLKSTVLVLFGATAILLLIACINVTNLLLSRATVRSREVALREAVGASRWRIVRQLLIESLVLTSVGGVIGLAMAVGGIRTFLAIAPTGLPRLNEVPINSAVVLFALGATVITGVLVGLAPAVRLAGNQLRSLINESGRGSPGGPTQYRVFGVLVVTEIALAVVLVIGAGLLVRSYYNLTTTNPGFNHERVLTISMNVPGRTDFSFTRTTQGPPQVRASYAPMGAFFRDLENRLAGVSGVRAVATTTVLPLAPGQTIVPIVFSLSGQVSQSADAAWTAPLSSVSPPFFDAMEMRLVEGRRLAWSDRQGSPGVAVVNESFARRFFPATRALGGRIRWKANRFVPTDNGFQFGHLTVDEVEIVGVVSDAKYVSLALPAEPAIYVSSEQFIHRRRAVVVRTSLDDPDSLVPAIRRELNAIDPQVGAEYAVYTAMVESSIARERLGMALLMTFGVVALALAAVGVYGLMSYSVAQRTGEMAVRSALGSSATQVMSLVMRRGIRLALAGIVLGVLGAVAMRRVLANQLYDISAMDPAVLLTVTALLFAVAAVACLLPALRATRVDPADLLRAE